MRRLLALLLAATSLPALGGEGPLPPTPTNYVYARSLGLADTRSYVERFGFPRSQLPGDLTMALGTASLTPLEVATGYAVFANGGYRVKPYLIDRVEDSAGAWLMQSQPLVACRDCGRAEARTSAPGELAGAPGTAVQFVPGDSRGLTRAADVGGSLPEIAVGSRAPAAITPANAFIITDMMRDVIRRGTGRRALALGRNDLAGKTGTTNERRDAWFSGFNASLVATAWIGFDQSRSLGTDEEGGRTALPMWVYFMEEALRDKPSHRQPEPPGVVRMWVSRETGQPARAGAPGALFEAFLEQSAPQPGSIDYSEEVGAETVQPASGDESLF